jgi:hypothetical protein
VKLAQVANFINQNNFTIFGENAVSENLYIFNF